MAIKGPHHLITISVPMPGNSAVDQNKIMAGYEKELSALRAKLPNGHEWDDHIRKPKATKKATAPLAAAAE
jgi:hypothetical protein